MEKMSDWPSVDRPISVNAAQITRKRGWGGRRKQEIGNILPLPTYASPSGDMKPFFDAWKK